MEIKLHIPKFEELAYREKLLNDPQTMSYNRGYDIDAENYDRATGCISFPRSEWQDWYDYFIGQEPERYYAYIECDGAFVGEVNLHKRTPETKVYDMGIVIEAQYRGKGISRTALEQLMDVAFIKLGAEEVRNEFEATRQTALRLHEDVGFETRAHHDGNVELVMDKKRYLSLKK